MAPRKRTPPPSDWLVWTYLMAQEILIGVRVCARLRDAGVMTLGDGIGESLTTDFYDGDVYNLRGLYSAKEIADRLPAKDIEALAKEWEAEIKRFGEILYAKYGVIRPDEK